MNLEQEMHENIVTICKVGSLEIKIYEFNSLNFWFLLKFEIFFCCLI